ncbi:hypothetical protein LPJ81_003865, partial [Coemansia sp. IMI 209127]
MKKEMEIIKKEQEAIEREEKLQIAKREVEERELELLRSEAELVDKFAEASLQEAIAQQRAKEVEKKESQVDFFRTEMFRIDRATPSIYDIDPTRSEILIEQTKEYREAGQKIMDKMFNKEITGIEGREILDDKVEELKRLMDSRRHKTKSVARKKIEKNYEKLMMKGWDKRDFDMDTVRHDDRALVSGD